MDFRPTDDQRDFRNSFARFIDEVIVPRGYAVDHDKEFPYANYKALAEVGYNGLHHEEKYGGSDLGAICVVVAQEELSRGCASTFLSVGASVGLFGGPVRRFASDEMKSEIIPGLVSGDLVGAWALTRRLRVMCWRPAIIVNSSALFSVIFMFHIL